MKGANNNKHMKILLAVFFEKKMHLGQLDLFGSSGH